MDSTLPADLLKLKTRLEAWRATRRYARQPIPDEFRQAAAEMTERHPLSLVRRVLKLECPFGRMASHLVKPVPAPFCRKDTKECPASHFRMRSPLFGTSAPPTLHFSYKRVRK